MSAQRLIPFMFCVCLWLAACGVMPGQPQTVASTGGPTPTNQAEVDSTNAPTSRATNTPDVVVDMSVALQVQQMLGQQLFADPNTIQIASVTERIWPDRCLSAPYADQLCSPQETVGYQIILAVNNQQYEYHTNLAGDDIRLVSAPQPAVDDPILTWLGADEVGCQRLEAAENGVAVARCGRPMLGVPYSIDSRPADLAEFANKYASFQAETAAGTVNFVGHGPNVATRAEQRMLGEWAKLVWLEAQTGRSDASAGLIFAWRGEAEQAGFCGDVSVHTTGQVFITSCIGGALPVDIAPAYLTPNQLDRVFGWVDTLLPFEHNPTDAPAADGMTTRLIFTGVGSQPANDWDIGLISEFAMSLFNEFSIQTGSPPETCLSPAQNQQLLVNEAHGYCLLYPEAYSWLQTNPDGTEIVKDTVMNHVDPRASINVEAVNGRDLAEIVAEVEANYAPAGFDVERSTITIDGTDAVVFDNLPGQDLNRRVIFIQNERLYHLFFGPIGEVGSEVRQQAELLFQQVIDSFRFLEVTE